MSHSIANIRPSEPHWLRTRVRFNRLKQKMRNRAQVSAQDVRDFLTAYCACFLAVTAFIA